MKKILIIVCVICLISIIAAYFIINASIKTRPIVHYPEYSNAPKETEVPKSTETIVVPIVSYDPTNYNTPKKTLAPSTPIPYVSGDKYIEVKSGEDNVISGQKEYAQDTILFLIDNNICCSLLKGQWNFDSRFKPSEILSPSSYYTYNNKGVKNVSNTLTSTYSVKYKDYVGTFAESFKTIATSINGYTATFTLPVNVPEGMDTYENFNGGELRFGDNSFFATNASYTINFASITANAYDPFGITNILDGGFTRKMIDVPTDVKEFLWGVIAQNGISPEVYYEIAYTCNHDVDRDGKAETLYFITSKTGENNKIEYDYIAEYGHLNMMLYKDNDDIKVIYGDYVPAHLTEDEIKENGNYNTALYRPTIADLNDDGLFEIISWLRKEDKVEQLMFIYDNNEFVRVK